MGRKRGQKKGKISQLNSMTSGREEVRKRKADFQKVAEDVRRKLQKEKVNGIVYMGIEGGEYSGGLVGDPETIAETLIFACKNNEIIYRLLDIVVRNCKELNFHPEVQAEVENAEIPIQETSISKLQDLGALNTKIRGVLEDNNVFDITEMKKYTEYEVSQWRGMGQKSLDQLKLIMVHAGVEFKRG